MSQHTSRRPGSPNSLPVDHRQPGPDTDEWPGEQMRRLDDDHRSWRQDRYREFSDQSSRQQQQRSVQPTPADDSASVRHRQARNSAP